MRPNISIITVTYNSEKLVSRCIESIYSQDYDDFEHIIVDAYSSDNTIKKVDKSFYKKSKIFYREKKGIYDAINFALSKCQGNIIGILHSDDYLYSNDIFSSIALTFSKNQDCNAIYGNINYISLKNKIIRRWISSKFSSKKIKYGWMPPHTSFYLKRNIFELIGIYDLSFKISSDYEFLLRFLTSNYNNCIYLNKFIVNMTIGGESNKNLINLINKSKEDYQIIKKYNLMGLITLFLKISSKFHQFFNVS